MKRTIIMAAMAIALAAYAPEAQAQGFLKGLADKAKEKVKEKVEGTVGKVAGKVLPGNGKETTATKANAKNNGETVTTNGTYSNEDPFQIYVENLAAPVDPKDWQSRYTSNTVEADNVVFNSMDEAVKAFPPLPTVEQVFSQDIAPVKALVNYKHGVNVLLMAISNHNIEAVENAKRNGLGKSSVSGGQRAQMEKGAAQIFAFMQKHGIDPEKMSEKEMEDIIKKAVLSGELKLEGFGGVAVNAQYTEAQEQAMDKVQAKIEALNAKAEEAVMEGSMVTLNAFNIKDILAPLYEEIQAAWLTSDACKKVHDIEADIDKRALEYFDKHPNGGNGAILDYPDFWVQGRKQQNEIIRKFNTEQAEKWRKKLQDIYDKHLPTVKEIPAVEKDLEAIFTDKLDITYNTMKSNLSSCLMQWSMLYEILLMRSYDAPLVSTVLEEAKYSY